MNIQIEDIQKDIIKNVVSALKEDIKTGDITAQLIPADQVSTATVITREPCIVCGRPWVDETFKRLQIFDIQWHINEGDEAQPNTRLFTVSGNTRAILTAERSALNFIQLLSGVATTANHYAQLVNGTNIKILDTRKTLPGLRHAQKYAVGIGGCFNHRVGLYDAFLIKENHIAGCGSITEAVEAARKLAPGKKVEVEVESLKELQQALRAKADIIMLDNFSEPMLQAMCDFEKGNTLYEVSGNMDAELVKMVSKYPIDYISIGALTKNCTAIDLSMRIVK